MTTIMYVSAILAVVIILTIIGVLSRYRRCKPNQVLVVYSKTGGEKKSAKLYHGGAAFVLPIIQSYDILSMEPMQIDCRLTGALSSQNIRVDVPTTITVAISTNPEIMQNAAERLLGMDTESTENLITDIVYGQMRLIIAEMTIEKLNSDRDEFLDKARKNIDNELNKLGLYLLNINISDIRAVKTAKELADKEVEEAKAKKVQAALKLKRLCRLKFRSRRLCCKLMPRPRRSNAGPMLKQQHIWQKQRRKQKLFRRSGSRR